MGVVGVAVGCVLCGVGVDVGECHESAECPKGAPNLFRMCTLLLPMKNYVHSPTTHEELCALCYYP